MLKGLYTAYTGMTEEQRRLDVLTNNLANANTTGYKKEALTNQSFDEMMAIRIKDTSSNTYATDIGYMSLGTKIGQTYTDWAMGGFKNTENTYDLAIGGNGFFAIEYTNKAGETSIKYTRDGNFTVDIEGYLRTCDGDYVLNVNGAQNSQYGPGNRVQLDPNQGVYINGLGEIIQDGETVSQVGLVDFENYDFLEKYGENLYDTIDGATMIDTTAEINQGYLETSNVNTVQEMVEMITIQRAYEAGQKIIQTMDSTLDKAVNQVGKL